LLDQSVERLAGVDGIEQEAVAAGHFADELHFFGKCARISGPLVAVEDPDRIAIERRRSVLHIGKQLAPPALFELRGDLENAVLEIASVIADGDSPDPGLESEEPRPKQQTGYGPTGAGRADDVIPGKSRPVPRMFHLIE